MFLFKLFESSPLVQKYLAEKTHDIILEILKGRFRRVPPDVSERLRTVLSYKKLRRIMGIAAQCSDIQAFRNGLASYLP
jgi:hypothetical protein